jgi:hypothetical protein
VQLLEGSILDRSGVEVVRARSLRVHRVQAGVAVPADPVSPPPGPEQGTVSDVLGRAGGTRFGGDAVELRFVAGSFLGLGPATAWLRLRVPVVEGLTPTPLERVAAAADFGNGISSPLSWDRHVFINPDLTIYLEREPSGEWIGLDASTRVAADGVGISESVLYDQRGRIGRAVQALLVALQG